MNERQTGSLLLRAAKYLLRHEDMEGHAIGEDLMKLYHQHAAASGMVVDKYEPRPTKRKPRQKRRRVENGAMESTEPPFPAQLQDMPSMLHFAAAAVGPPMDSALQQRFDKYLERSFIPDTPPQTVAASEPVTAPEPVAAPDPEPEPMEVAPSEPEKPASPAPQSEKAVTPEAEDTWEACRIETHKSSPPKSPLVENAIATRVVPAPSVQPQRTFTAILPKPSGIGFSVSCVPVPRINNEDVRKIFALNQIDVLQLERSAMDIESAYRVGEYNTVLRTLKSRRNAFMHSIGKPLSTDGLPMEYNIDVERVTYQEYQTTLELYCTCCRKKTSAVMSVTPSPGRIPTLMCKTCVFQIMVCIYYNAYLTQMNRLYDRGVKVSGEQFCKDIKEKAMEYGKQLFKA